MLFAANGNLYLDEWNPNLKIFPKVKIVRLEDGTCTVEKMMTGIKKKPAVRELLTLNEAKARYGEPEASKED